MYGLVNMELGRFGVSVGLLRGAIGSGAILFWGCIDNSLEGF